MKLNLDTLEAELKEISPWPWRGDWAVGIIEGQSGIIYDENICQDETNSSPLEKNDFDFIVKAPETIHALIEEVKKYRLLYESEARKYEYLKAAIPSGFKSEIDRLCESNQAYGKEIEGLQTKLKLAEEGLATLLMACEEAKWPLKAEQMTPMNIARTNLLKIREGE